jgi:guanylate kinase
MNRPTRLYVISAPSGAGKTSLCKALLAKSPSLCVSVSHTTRAQRSNEQDGRDYHFISVPEFQRLRAAGAFLESAQVFDNYYGTGRDQVGALLASGRDVLLEIDWQGARQVRAAQPDCISIFILPPSRAELERRLRSRLTDSDEVIARRLRDAASDMSHCPEFDFAVVNDQFETALAQLQDIIGGRGASLRSDRPELAPLLAQLVA